METTLPNYSSYWNGLSYEIFLRAITITKWGVSRQQRCRIAENGGEMRVEKWSLILSRNESQTLQSVSMKRFLGNRLKMASIQRVSARHNFFPLFFFFFFFFFSVFSYFFSLGNLALRYRKDHLWSHQPTSTFISAMHHFLSSLFLLFFLFCLKRMYICKYKGNYFDSLSLLLLLLLLLL